MTRRLLPPLLCGLLLVGCDWTGAEGFYTASEARAPIVPGDYRIEYGGRPGPDREGVRVSIRTDGLTSFVPLRGRRSEAVAGFTPLGPEAGRYVLWITRMEGDFPPGRLVFLLLERGAGRSYRTYFPNCGSNSSMAVSAGAAPSEAGPLAECRFPDRASLEAGLAAFARHPGESAELVPIR